MESKIWDKAYIITLKKHVNRFRRIKKKLKVLGKVKKFDGIDGFKKFELYGNELMKVSTEKDKWQVIKKHNQKLKDKNIIAQDTLFYFKPGQLGHYYSYYKILEDAIKKKLNSILILEDDIDIVPDFKNKFNNVIENLPEDWDLLYFSLHKIHKRKSGEIIPINDYLGKATGMKINNPKYKGILPGTHAICLNKTAIRMLYENAFPIKEPTDHYLSRFIKNNQLNHYIILKPIITTYHATSSTELMGGFRYDIIKELGRGLKGISWLIKKDGKTMVLKRQRVLKREIKRNDKSPIWREISFLLDVRKFKKEYQNKFIKMYRYEFSKCNDFKHNSDSSERDKSDYCADLFMEYRGESTMSIVLKDELEYKERLSLLLQVISSFAIMKKYNYSHDDISFNNITMETWYSKSLITNGYQDYFLYFKSRFTLIDYGTAFNTKQRAKPNFAKFKIDNLENNGDMVQVILKLCVGTNMLTYNNKTKPKINSNKLVKLIPKNYPEIWKLIKKYILNHLSEKFHIYLEYIENDNLEQKYKENNFNVISKISLALFSQINRKKFIEFVGHDEDPGEFIDNETIDYFIKNFYSYSRIIKYLTTLYLKK